MAVEAIEMEDERLNGLSIRCVIKGIGRGRKNDDEVVGRVGVVEGLA